MKNFEKLFLSGWQYNSYLIINKLAEMVKKEGGEFVDEWPHISHYYAGVEIVNRSILENIAENERILNGRTEKEIRENEFLTKKAKELDELKAINNEPKKLIFKNYLHFALNSVIYYVQLQDNPFFEDYIIKEEAEKIEEGYKVTYNHYMEELSKKWIEDAEEIASFYQTLTEKQVKTLAKRLFEQIKAARLSEVVTQKRRVSNYYNNSYHYEHIKEEKQHKIFKVEKIEE